jgi:hypothetical protein
LARAKPFQWLGRQESALFNAPPFGCRHACEGAISFPRFEQLQWLAALFSSDLRLEGGMP